MSAIRIRAHCKINLCLEILGRRPDGYHDLATVFQAVSLADEMTVEVLEEERIEVAVPKGGAPEGPENLCWRAAERYQARCHWPQGVRIVLHKRVPAASGLGGGSTDAAAVLTALASLDGDAPAGDVLKQIAAELGSDVAFFLGHGTALGRGRGERLSTLPPLPECRVVLVRPDLAVPTAEAYAMLGPDDYTDGRRAEAMAAALRGGRPLVEVLAHARNGFTRALVERWPVLGELTERLRQAGALASQISGSGSAVFGLFEAEPADALLEALCAAGHWVRVVVPVRSGCDIVERTE